MRSLFLAPPPASTSLTRPTTPSTAIPSPPPSVVRIAIFSGLFIILIFCILLVLCKKKKTRTHPQVSSPKGCAVYPSHHKDHVITMPPLELILSDHVLEPSPSSTGDHVIEPSSPHCVNGISKTIFTYEDLANATQGFSHSDDSILGKGGFGYVHKGVLPNGEEVAVKKLKTGSRQGELEFQTEVAVASRLQHKHLVSLVGYCTYGNEKMLVYEFVPNKTLEFHLHGNGNNVLSWDMRMKIAIGIAKGLTYLHDECKPKIIHGDVKSTNILLDTDFEPKVADFGFARSCPDTDSHVSTRVIGTFGYLDPEYVETGRLTEKSDVYSFGVILLELITGCQPIDIAQSSDYNIVGWAKPLLKQVLDDGNFSSLVDPRLQNNYKYSAMRRMILCAALCVCRLRRRRPSMSQIIGALEGDLTFKCKSFKKRHLKPKK